MCMPCRNVYGQNRQQSVNTGTRHRISGPAQATAAKTGLPKDPGSQKSSSPLVPTPSRGVGTPHRGWSNKWNEKGVMRVLGRQRGGGPISSRDDDIHIQQIGGNRVEEHERQKQEDNKHERQMFSSAWFGDDSIILDTHPGVFCRGMGISKRDLILPNWNAWPPFTMPQIRI